MKQAIEKILSGKTIVDYMGTSVWYAADVLKLCRIDERLKTSIAEKSFSADDKNQVLFHAVNVCKTCKMAREVVEVVLSVIGSDDFDIYGEIGVEDIARMYLDTVMTCYDINFPGMVPDIDFFAEKE